MSLANQHPVRNQPFQLSTDRQVSSIPKAIVKEGESPYWLYPSQQMLWDAILSKDDDDDDDITPQDMENMVKIHNANNELTWQDVLKWEALHAHECGNPRLKSFGERVTKYSPRALVRYSMGCEFPFDRRDWIIDRCGKEVHYVIEYYESEADNDNHTATILDVRPALDSFENVWDRIKVALLRRIHSKE